MWQHKKTVRAVGSRSDLSGAVLSGANLYEANLSEANLNGANLSEARDLFQSQVNSARGDADTRLPEGSAHPDRWK